jgi:uncharacterized membrane protein
VEIYHTPPPSILPLCNVFISPFLPSACCSPDSDECSVHQTLATAVTHYTANPKKLVIFLFVLINWFIMKISYWQLNSYHCYLILYFLGNECILVKHIALIPVLSTFMPKYIYYSFLLSGQTTFFYYRYMTTGLCHVSTTTVPQTLTQIVQFLCSPVQLKFQTVVCHVSAEQTILIPVWKQHTHN